MAEVWHDVEGYVGLYQVSDLGRVRSLDQPRHVGHGVTGLHRGRVLKPYQKSNGYLYVGLRGSHKSLHRLVMTTFRPCESSKDLQVNHINGVKTDNRLVNLEWCSARENSLHAYHKLNRTQITSWRKPDGPA